MGHCNFAIDSSIHYLFCSPNSKTKANQLNLNQKTNTVDQYFKGCLRYIETDKKLHEDDP